eukprot:TRINITY_DN10158_c0_g1_i1.p1 TRINITY_DN10158_c0_g1~~TRINITY_DN10158_c0_g1_i1.p1  ORF type:complete len:718 (-),score=134.38 TRINITY_DN10158_c0_g1_i1:87-2240(-)
MDFVILTVNGVDVSDCSHEEAVKRFMEAKEPIVVEVKRRNSTTTVNNAQHSDENNQQKAQRACQDEKQIYQPPSSISREVQTEIDTANNCLRCVDYYGYNTSKSDENLIFPDFEYEEIDLKRPNPAERLGLTLCYEDEDEEGNTEIFIDDIHPDGLAARDGRLRLGDQIIQINGVKVKTKQKAQEMFIAIKGDISLLVVRPPANGDCYEEDLDNLLDVSEHIGDKFLSEEYAEHILRGDLNELLSRKRILSKNRLSSTSSKDSGHNSGTIDRSTTNSSNSASSKISSKSVDDMFSKAKDDHDVNFPSRKSNMLGDSKGSIYSTDSEFYYVDGKLKDISEFYKEMKSRGVRSSDHLVTDIQNNYIDPIYEMIPEMSESDDMYCIPQDSKPRIIIQPQSPCRENKIKLKSQEKLKSLCRSISSPMKMNEFLLNKVKRSTSNHNHNMLNECNNKQPTNDKEKHFDVQTWLRETEKSKVLISNQMQCPEPSLRLNSSNHPSGSTLSLVVANSSHSSNSNKSAKTMSAPPADSGIVYTNIDNLERTIRAQQEKLLNQINQQPKFIAPPPPMHPPPSPNHHEQSTSFMTDQADHRENDSNWEWKIKVRPDGTRYIARRPVRNLLLRQRERQIAEERSGFTTDDDAVSEIKTGKFWTKDERRKHVELSKERRKRQEDVIRTKTSLPKPDLTRSNLVATSKRHSYQETSTELAKTESMLLTVATV